MLRAHHTQKPTTSCHRECAGPRGAAARARWGAAAGQCAWCKLRLPRLLQEIPPDERQYTGVVFGEKPTPVLSLATARSGSRLAASGNGGLVRLYRVEMKRARACELHVLCSVTALGDVRTVALDWGACLFVTGGDKKIVQIWSFTSSNRPDGAELGEPGRAEVISTCIANR